MIIWVRHDYSIQGINHLFFLAWNRAVDILFEGRLIEYSIDYCLYCRCAAQSQMHDVRNDSRDDVTR